jgi:bifunctional non-homologous end joining protein LigD
VPRSSDKLATYRSKRKFDKTPEPAGEPASEQEERETVASGRFVVQQHDATNLHWDLRLEHEGVALSWALPRGIPQLPTRAANRLAVHTEDHPVKYLTWSGEIPKGEYGGGTMTIWDSGTYEAQKMRDNEVIARFDGERMIGSYALFQTRGKNWMIHRIDPPLDPEREPFPDEMRPMQAVRGELPEGPGWGHEIDWGGLRTLVWVEPGHIKRSLSRGLEDETVALFPEIRRLARSIGHLEVVLDGEIVVLGEDGAPNAERLRERKRASSKSVAERLARDRPATLQLFDVLFLDGHSTLELPYSERRELLEDLELSGRAWATPANHTGEGGPLLEAASARGLAGLVAKRLDSTYRPGRRSEDWVKVRA